MNIIKQRTGKIQKNGARIYVEDNQLPFDPDERYTLEIETDKHIVKVVSDPNGEFKTTRRTKIDKKTEEVKSVNTVIDKAGNNIKEALEGCDSLKITFYEDKNGKGLVQFEGTKNTAKVLNNRPNNQSQLTSITFCAGAGLSSQCNVNAGFKEVAAVEYNPKEGKDNRFADVYQTNHPETIMFNIPMEQLDAKDLPDVDFWLCTLDCTDFSKAKRSGTHKTMHLFVHLMRLFYQKPKGKRPKAIMVENVEGFEKVAGNTLKLCLEEEGYEVKMAKLNSLDYSSRTKRIRFFLVATVFEGFEFPAETGRLDTPITADGIMKVSNIDWTTPEENSVLSYYLNRTKDIKSGNTKHNFRVSTIDITKDKYIGTITKSFHRGRAENILKHPTEEKYAFLHNVDHLRYIHGINPDYYLGDTHSIRMEAIGQGICSITFNKIILKLHNFLENQILKQNDRLNAEKNKPVQLCFAV